MIATNAMPMTGEVKGGMLLICEGLGQAKKGAIGLIRHWVFWGPNWAVLDGLGLADCDKKTLNHGGECENF